MEDNKPIVPTRLICRRLTAKVGRFPSAYSSGFRMLNMFDRGSQPAITESMVKSADSVDSTTYSSPNLTRIGVWVWVAYSKLKVTKCIMYLDQFGLSWLSVVR